MSSEQKTKTKKASHRKWPRYAAPALAGLGLASAGLGLYHLVKSRRPGVPIDHGSDEYEFVHGGSHDIGVHGNGSIVILGSNAGRLPRHDQETTDAASGPGRPIVTLLPRRYPFVSDEEEAIKRHDLSELGGRKTQMLHHPVEFARNYIFDWDESYWNNPQPLADQFNERELGGMQREAFVYQELLPGESFYRLYILQPSQVRAIHARDRPAGTSNRHQHGGVAAQAKPRRGRVAQKPRQRAKAGKSAAQRGRKRQRKKAAK